MTVHKKILFFLILQITGCSTASYNKIARHDPTAAAAAATTEGIVTGIVRKDKKLVLNGMCFVKDYAGIVADMPCVNQSLSIGDANGKNIIQVKTDSQGRFRIPIELQNSATVSIRGQSLEVEKIETIEGPEKNNLLQVYLKPTGIK